MVCGSPLTRSVAVACSNVVDGSLNETNHPQASGAPVRVLVQRLHPLAVLPRYAWPHDAGADLVTTESAVLEPGARAVLPTGLAMALPAGYAAFIHPRSGLAARVGLGLVNSPGTIDAGFRGELRVIVINLDPSQPIRLAAGDRIAQLVIQRVASVDFVEAGSLPPAQRGTGGHGSTGGAIALQSD